MHLRARPLTAEAFAPYGDVLTPPKDPGRSYFPKDGLVNLARYEVPTTRELEDMEVKKTGVWTFPD